MITDFCIILNEEEKQKKECYIEDASGVVRIIFNPLAVMEQPNKQEDEGKDAKQLCQSTGTIRTHLVGFCMKGGRYYMIKR